MELPLGGKLVSVKELPPINKESTELELVSNIIKELHFNERLWLYYYRLENNRLKWL